jgi:hypothetical protein
LQNVFEFLRCHGAMHSIRRVSTIAALRIPHCSDQV